MWKQSSADIKSLPQRTQQGQMGEQGLLNLRYNNFFKSLKFSKNFKIYLHLNLKDGLKWRQFPAGCCREQEKGEGEKESPNSRQISVGNSEGEGEVEGGKEGGGRRRNERSCQQCGARKGQTVAIRVPSYPPATPYHPRHLPHKPNTWPPHNPPGNPPSSSA